MPVNAAIKPNSEINVSKQVCSLFYKPIVAVRIKIKTIPTHSNKYTFSNIPSQCCLPAERMKDVSAAVGGNVRKSQSVKQHVEAEPGQGRGHRPVPRCSDDGLDAVLQRKWEVNRLQRHKLQL